MPILKDTIAGTVMRAVNRAEADPLYANSVDKAWKYPIIEKSGVFTDLMLEHTRDAHIMNGLTKFSMKRHTPEPAEFIAVMHPRAHLGMPNGETLGFKFVSEMKN